MTIVFGSEEAEQILEGDRARAKYSERLEEIAVLIEQYKQEVQDIEDELRTDLCDEDREFTKQELAHAKHQLYMLYRERGAIMVDRRRK